MKSFNVEILSPKKPMAMVQAEAVAVPGLEGYMEIMPGHAPLVSELYHGYLKVVKPSGSKVDLLFFVSGGYVEVLDGQVRVLVNVAETPEEIDLQRAEDARRRAEERLSGREKLIDLNRAQAALLRALARIDFVKMVSKNK